MWAYGAIGVLAALTGGLGNALVTANLAFFQGTLGLTAEEAAWIPAAYVMTNVCANLVLVKFRQQFGLGLFIQLILILLCPDRRHPSVRARLLVRDPDPRGERHCRGRPDHAGRPGAVAGDARAQAPARDPDRYQRSAARHAARPHDCPSLLEWGDWRMAYFFELGLALLTLAAVLALPLPPERA